MRTKRNIKISSLIESEKNYYISNCNFNKNNKEYEIFNMLYNGCSRVEIADKVHLSIDTISSRTNDIYNKIKKVTEK